MNFIYGLIVGAFAVWCIYHFSLQPMLKAKRDAAEQKLTDFLKGKGKGQP